MEPVNKTGKRILLILQRAAQAHAVCREVIHEGRIIHDPAPQRNRIDVITDVAAQLRLRPPGERHPDDDIILLAVAMHEDVVGREQCRKEGDVALLRKGVD